MHTKKEQKRSTGGSRRAHFMAAALPLLFLVLAVLGLFYAGIVASVGSGTFSFVIWILEALFFGALSFFTWNGRYRRMPAWFRRGAMVIIGIGLFVFLILESCILSKFRETGAPGADYLIVLGAQMRDNGPATVYRYRLDAAYRYLLENEDTVCVVTGGQGANESISEGEGGAEYLADKGISRERLLTETESLDTPANLANAKELILSRTPEGEVPTVCIVTSNFHLFRGMRLAKKLDFASVSGIAAHTEPLFLPNNMVRESAGILRDFLRGKL